MISIVKERDGVSVVLPADIRYACRKHDTELAHFDKDYCVEDTAQEILELLVALNVECEIVEG